MVYITFSQRFFKYLFKYVKDYKRVRKLQIITAK